MGDPGMAIAEFTNALILDPGFLNALEPPGQGVPGVSTTTLGPRSTTGKPGG